MPENTATIWPKNRICELFGIAHPIIQAGMIWVSGGKLAAAASNAGCLGIVGAGSMKPDVLRMHLQKAKSLTAKPLGVNIPLLYRDADQQIQTALDEGVRIFFTSAGSPKTFTPQLKKAGCTVVHVTSTPELARKCEDAGVDAVVLEGFEAGGHNGRDETTTLVLLQQTFGKLSIPILAAGGIGSGSALAAAFALGAEGVQIGTLFAATAESSAHKNFKDAMIQAKNNSTFLRLKKLVPVRLLENDFSQKVGAAEERCATAEELAEILGKGRARAGMLEGDLKEGELEIGQVVSTIQDIPSCQILVERLISEYQRARERLFV
jgi:enoyl-[acyl-carrier protein] reductase II